MHSFFWIPAVAGMTSCFSHIKPSTFLITGKETLEEVFLDKRNYRILWLEILFNDRVSWETYLDRPEVREAYEKACIWFTQFKTMIQVHTRRKPLESHAGKIDQRDYRRFFFFART